MCNSLIHSRDHWKPYQGGLVFEESDSHLHFPAGSARMEMDIGRTPVHSSFRRFAISPSDGGWSLKVAFEDADYETCRMTQGTLDEAVAEFGRWYHLQISHEILRSAEDQMAPYGYRPNIDRDPPVVPLSL
jgi:hypothetical protein